MFWKNWPYWVRGIFIAIIPYLFALLFLSPLFTKFDTLQVGSFFFLFTFPIAIIFAIFIGYHIEKTPDKKPRRLLPFLIVTFIGLSAIYFLGEPVSDLAVSTNSPQLCKLVPTSALTDNDRSECYWRVAKGHTNIKACEYYAALKNKSIGECLTSLAHESGKTLGKELCEMISEPGTYTKERCLSFWKAE